MCFFSNSTLCPAAVDQTLCWAGGRQVHIVLDSAQPCLLRCSPPACCAVLHPSAAWQCLAATPSSQHSFTLPACLPAPTLRCPAGHLDLLKVSLPVKMFEPRSYLQKLADPWVRAHNNGVPCGVGAGSGAGAHTRLAVFEPVHMPCIHGCMQALFACACVGWQPEVPALRDGGLSRLAGLPALARKMCGSGSGCLRAVSTLDVLPRLYRRCTLASCCWRRCLRTR